MRILLAFAWRQLARRLNPSAPRRSARKKPGAAPFPFHRRRNRHKEAPFPFIRA
jgi:hypothetical protein